MDTQRFRRTAGATLCGVVALIGAVAVMPTAASADITNCEVTLVDTLGFEWDFNPDGSVNDGGLPEGSLDDAYDDYGRLSISTNGGETFTDYGDSGGGEEFQASAAAVGDPCSFEDGDREVAYPVHEIDGLEVSRKTFVPGAGDAFARWADVIHNPTAEPITVTRRFDGNLGSDSQTVVTAESSGDETVDGTDTWAASGGDENDPRLGHTWDGTTADGRREDADDAYLTGYSQTDVFYAEHADVVIEPGRTAVFLHIGAQRSDDAEAAAAAQAFGDQTAVGGAIFAGLQECSDVRNWRAGADICDRDADGVVDAADNCLVTPNADQSDIDGDGLGDVCDLDADGDGISNGAEQEVGLNPLSRDTDGDGVADRADACPVRAGTTADGCPAASVVVQERLSDVTPPKLGLTYDRSITLRRLLAGLPVDAICDEPCSLRARLLVRQRDLSPSRSARSSAFNRTLARENRALGGGGRTLTVRPCERRSNATSQSRSCVRRLARLLRDRKFEVRLEVVARDAARNDSHVIRTIRVR